MKLSRKPRNLVIVMLMAVFLMTMAGVAMAVQNVNWNWIGSGSILYAKVYETNTAGDVYAAVYATINGQTAGPFNTVTSSIYGDGSGANNITIPLISFTNLVPGTSYAVYLKVYADNNPSFTSPTGPITYVSPAAFLYTSGSTGSPGSNPSGGTTAATPTTPAATVPTVNASFGTAVSISASTGASVQAAGVTIDIPAGALAADVKVTVTKVANAAGLTVPANAKIIGDILEIIKDKTGNFSKPVTISLNFDKSKVDTTKFDVKVCFYDETNKTWVPLDNITVSDGKVSGDVTHFTKFAVLTFPKEAAKPAAGTLSDTAGHWAEANIKKLVDAKAIAGYPDGTFKPNNTITRAEFATVLVKALNIAPSSDKVFADTASHWAKDSISAAAAAGIVNGYSATQFGPNDPITREQMAVMIVKAAKLAKAEGKTFSDGAAIAAWAKDAVASATAAGVMSGYPDNSFKPQGNATRAEAVTVIVKAMK